MNANLLARLYQDWKAATLAESNAIQQKRWHDLPVYHAQKETLQREIIRTTDAWRQQWPRTGESDKDYDRQFRPIVSELICMETTNMDLLSDAMQSQREQIAEVDCSARTLRGVQRAYGGGAGTHWASYS